MNQIRLIGLLAVGAAILVTGVGLDCALAAPFRQPIGPQPMDAPPNRLDWSTTYVAIEFDGRTWTELLTWFAAKTQMTIDARSNAPGGTLHVITPKHRLYSLADIYDLVNRRAQAEEKFTLLRGESDLGFFPADDPHGFPAHLISRVQLEDLPRRGQTEIVDVVMSRQAAKEAGLEPFEPLGKGPFRQFTAARPAGNDCVIIRCDVATLRRHCNVGPR